MRARPPAGAVELDALLGPRGSDNPVFSRRWGHPCTCSLKQRRRCKGALAQPCQGTLPCRQLALRQCQTPKNKQPEERWTAWAAVQARTPPVAQSLPPR